MKRYAVLDNDSKVSNIIIASSLDAAELVSSSRCALIAEGISVDMGYTYSDGAFTAPAEETPSE